jgi:hypothetical protein
MGKSLPDFSYPAKEMTEKAVTLSLCMKKGAHINQMRKKGELPGPRRTRIREVVKGILQTHHITNSSILSCYKNADKMMRAYSYYHPAAIVGSTLDIQSVFYLIRTT